MTANNGMNNNISKRRTIFQRKTLLIFFSVVYSFVLVGNYYMHKHLSDYLSDGEGLIADFFGQKQSNEESKLPNPIHALGELYDGKNVTSILLEQMLPPQSRDASPIRLRFQPGTLNLTPEQTLSYCHVDTNIYKQHFSQSSRLVSPISDKHKLIYLMIPKSASSTARWMMENVLNATDTPLSGTGHELNPNGEYENYTTLTFVRDPLSRFYSSYDETFMRFGPWMKKRKGEFFKRYNEFVHPYPYLYEGMTEWGDYQAMFCPESLGWKQKRCMQSESHENGTLARRFERFVWDYDGVSPFDLVRVVLLDRLLLRCVCVCGS